MIDEPSYRYILTDFLSGDIIGEVPFSGVSYERVLKRAGSFSGSIAYIPETAHLNLYENTMPGRTALYVMRDNVCVWGGIIWSRSYDSANRTLTVNASEHISYFYHRYIWQTLVYFAPALGVNSYSITGGVATITLGEDHNFTAGMPVKLYRVGTPVDGVHTIATALTPRTFTFSTTQPDGSGTTIDGYCKYFYDNYDVVRDMLAQAATDFGGLQFDNDEIEPARNANIGVTSYSVSSGVISITTEDPHGLIPGQTFRAKNFLGSPFDSSYYTVLTAPTSTTLTANADAGTPSNVGTTALGGYQIIDVTSKRMVANTKIGTITTATNHGLTTGDIVEIFINDGFFDGMQVVTGTPTPNTFTFVRSGYIFADIPLTNVEWGYITGGNFLMVGTYGSYTSNSDPGYAVQTQDSGRNQESQTIRGYNLSSFGDVIETFSNDTEGFEYRIDSEYDALNDTFVNTFVFIDKYLPTPPPPGGYYSIADFGADVLVFEYPGNVASFTVDESAENAATRMWMVGNIEGMSSEASQPYAAAIAADLLNPAPGERKWPLLDQAESQQDVFSEEQLYTMAQDYLAEARPPVADIKISINGSLDPAVGSYVPGDWCSVVFTDQFMKERLADSLEPRSNVLVRKIVSYRVTVPDYPHVPEQVDIELIADWQVDRRGD